MTTLDADLAAHDDGTTRRQLVYDLPGGGELLVEIWDRGAVDVTVKPAADPLLWDGLRVWGPPLRPTHDGRA